jgi:AcrR family transcriptional regulator
MLDLFMSATLDLGAGTPAPHDPQQPVTARDRLLRAAADLFCRYGINATGVDAVVEAAGTAKATLYKIFGSKEGLIEAVLDQEGAVWRTWFISRIDNTLGSASDKLVGMFDALGDWFAEDRFFGCPFINAVGEFDKKDQRYKDIALAHKSVVMRRITALTAEAGCSEPETAAHQLGLLIDGAIVAALITGDKRIAKHGRNAAENILKCNACH